MNSTPKELLVELLSYSGLIVDPKIRIRVNKYVDLFSNDEHFNVYIIVIRGIRAHKQQIAYRHGFTEFKAFILNAISLKSDIDKYTSTIENDELIINLDKGEQYIFPLEKYGDTIRNEFERIAREYKIEEIQFQQKEIKYAERSERIAS